MINTDHKKIRTDLRKLIKYEEHMGVNTHHDDYFENLFRRTTASFRAKVDKENVHKGSTVKSRTKGHDDADERPTTSKTAQCRQRTLQERNHQRQSDSTTTSGDSFDARLLKSNNVKHSKGTTHNSLKRIVEDLVTQMLKEKFSNSQDKNIANCGQSHKVTFMNAQSMNTVVADLVNKILKDKLTGQHDSNAGHGTKPIKSIIEDIVTEKLKQHFANSLYLGKEQNKTVNQLNPNMPQNLNLPKDRLGLSSNPNKTPETEALMAELLGDTDPKSKDKQRSPKTRSQTPEWEKLGREKAASVGITRLPRVQGKAPEWQKTDGKSRPRSTSALKDRRARSPAPSTSGRSSRSRMKGNGVLIPRSYSHGRSNKPNNADPVALYQYYKSEWEHFRQQIPGEADHNRLRWHVRQRLLDPE